MVIAASISVFGSSISAAFAADEIAIATITAGRLFVLGTTSEPRQRVVLDGRYETTSDDARSFQFELVYHPATCIVGATIGGETREAVVSNCGQRDAKAGSEAAAGGRRDRQVTVPPPAALPELPRPPSVPVAQEAPALAALPVPEAREPEAKPPVAAVAAPPPAPALRAMARAPSPPARPSEARLKTAQAKHDDRARRRPAPSDSIRLAAESGSETADRKAKPVPKPLPQRRKPAPAKPDAARPDAE